ncbi:MAG: electron transport complex subunit RsxC [Arsenophonus sp.]
MFDFLKKLILNKDKNFTFLGSIYISKIKKQSKQSSLVEIPLSNKLIIPVQRYINKLDDIIVKINQHVLKGQLLTKCCYNNIPLHATTSGTIVSILPHITTNSYDLKELCIILEPDNKDQWFKRKPLTNYLECSSKDLLSYITQAGISVLDVTGFFTEKTLKNMKKIINTLIINTAECEHYITDNVQLIQERVNEIIEGILILTHIIKPKKVLIIIEDNKLEEITAFKKALLNQESIIKLKIITTKYNYIRSKQLDKILTKKSILSVDNYDSDSILIKNIRYIFAIKRAIINGEPLIESVVTLTGDELHNPLNCLVRFGTSINFILQQVGIVTKLEQIVIINSQSIKFPVYDLNAPISRITNHIFIPRLAEIKELKIEKACIRCGICAQVCPVNLLPQQLYWFSRGHNNEKMKKYNLSSCTECGACIYVCPSNIPLVRYYREKKAEIEAITKEKLRISATKKRFEAKKTRFEQEKFLRQQKNLYRENSIQIKHKDKIGLIDELALLKAQKNYNDENKIELFCDQIVIKNKQFRKSQQSVINSDKSTLENQSVTPIKEITKEQEVNRRKSIITAAIARSKAKFYNKIKSS